MATATPGKAKAYLGKVKETVVGSTDTTVHNAFRTLLLLETVQRGVLPPPPLQTIEPGNGVDEKVLELVRSVAGKALATDGVFPKPLLAGSAAMMGMVAEKCADLVLPQDGTTTATTTTIALVPNQQESLLDAVQKRCEEVNDERFRALLLAARTGSNNLSTQYLLHIAEGCFLRAASWQPDQPQMWKKALDAIEKRTDLRRTTASGTVSESPYAAAFPLENMIRVAAVKGNSKRIYELSPKLAESWLSDPKEQTNGNDDTNVTVIIAAFVNPYKPNDDKKAQDKNSSSSTLEARAGKAREALSRMDSLDTIRCRRLSLRVEMADEEATVSMRAEELYNAAKNRGSQLTREGSVGKAQSERLQEALANSSEKDAVHTAAVALMKVLLDNWESLGNDQDNVDGNIETALEMLVEQIERAMEGAKVVGKAPIKKTKDKLLRSAWIAVNALTGPIMEKLQSLIGWQELGDGDNTVRRADIISTVLSASSGTVTIMQKCLSAIVMTLWLDPSPPEWIYDPRMLLFAEDICAGCMEVVKTHQKEQNAANASDVKDLTNTQTALESAKSDLDCIQAGLLGYRGLLSRNDQEETMVDTILNATDVALVLSSQDATLGSRQAAYGVSFILCMTL